MWVGKYKKPTHTYTTTKRIMEVMRCVDIVFIVTLKVRLPFYPGERTHGTLPYDLSKKTVLIV